MMNDAPPMGFFVCYLQLMACTEKDVISPLLLFVSIRIEYNLGKSLSVVCFLQGYYNGIMCSWESDENMQQTEWEERSLPVELLLITLDLSNPSLSLRRQYSSTFHRTSAKWFTSQQKTSSSVKSRTDHISAKILCTNSHFINHCNANIKLPNGLVD